MRAKSLKISFGLALEKRSRMTRKQILWLLLGFSDVLMKKVVYKMNFNPLINACARLLYSI